MQRQPFFPAIDSGVSLTINASIDEVRDMPGAGVINSRTTPPRPVAFVVDIISLFSRSGPLPLQSRARVKRSLFKLYILCILYAVYYTLRTRLTRERARPRALYAILLVSVNSERS